VVSEVISDSSGVTSNFTKVTREASWLLYDWICPTTVANDSYHG
jgi:hypothetical protein